MALTLKLISSNHLIDGQAAEHTFNELGGTIGRKPNNDFILLDPERFISGKHALIEYKNGQYYITDTSTNGIFINDSKAPLGQGNTTELMSGDKVAIGTYMLLAHCTDPVSHQPKSPISSTPRETDNLFEDPLDDLVSNSADMQGDTPALGSVDPLDLLGINDNQPSIPNEISFDTPEQVESVSIDDLGIFGETEPMAEEGNIDDIFSSLNEESTAPEPVERQQPVTIDESFTPPSNFIPEDWDSLDLGAEPLSPAPKVSPEVPEFEPLNDIEEPGFDPLEHIETPAQESTQEHLISSEPDVAPSPIKPEIIPPAADPIPTKGGYDGEALINAFLEGAKISAEHISFSNNTELMRKIGELTRISAHGLMQALQARATIKSGFRVNKTTIAPVENNPLKFSVTDDEALQILLSDDRKGYMPATHAFNEGFSDLQTHQMALMAGLQATISTIVSQFDPEQLESAFDNQSGSSFIPGQKKARNWDQYIDFYNRLNERFQDDFQNVYGEEFAKAYEEQVAKLMH